MKSLPERMPHPSKCFNTTGNSWELDCSQELEVNKKATWLLLTDASEHLHQQLQSRLRQNFYSLEPRAKTQPIHEPKKERHLPHMPAGAWLMAPREKSVTPTQDESVPRCMGQGGPGRNFDPNTGFSFLEFLYKDPLWILQLLDSVLGMKT